MPCIRQHSELNFLVSIIQPDLLDCLLPSFCTVSLQEFEIELEGSQTLRLLCYEKCYNKAKQNREDGENTDRIMAKGQIQVWSEGMKHMLCCLSHQATVTQLNEIIGGLVYQDPHKLLHMQQLLILGSTYNVQIHDKVQNSYRQGHYIKQLKKYDNTKTNIMHCFVLLLERH